MLIASLKLCDIGARSLFVLLVLFSLPAREAGQFGMLLILTAFYAFFAGYERYLDLQRNLAGLNDPAADQLLISALRLYGVNGLLALPVFTACLLLWVELPPSLAAMGAVVAVGEHLSNEAYRVALISHRYRQFLIVALIKNIVLVAAIAAIWLSDHALLLTTVIKVWGALSAGVLVVLSFMFVRNTTDASGPLTSLKHQLRASHTHFVVGLIAVLSLQIDRLIAGALLSFESSGAYFRHVFLASVAYQALGILSVNRIMPRVYRHFALGEKSAAAAIVRRERVCIVFAYGAFAAVALALRGLGPENWPALERIDPSYLVILIVAFLLRNIGDYNSLVLNAVFCERAVLRSQVFALASSFLSSIVLTPLFGIGGLLVSVVVGAAAYLMTSTLLTRRAVSAHEEAP